MLNRLYSWYGKSVVRIVIAVVLVLILIVVFSSRGEEVKIEKTNTAPVVKTAAVSALSGSTELQLIGNVRAVSEAEIQSEISGRVTTVNVKINDRVAPGQVIARLENAAESAALIQAEGAYEAAQAGAAQSNIDVSEAENSLIAAQNSAISTYRTTYTMINDVVINTIDTFFSSPDKSVPGLKINGGQFTSKLNNDRVLLRQILPEWRASVNQLNTQSNLDEMHRLSEANTHLVLTMVDILLERVDNVQNNNRTIDGVSMESFKLQLSSTRSVINNSLSSLDTTKTTLVNAEETLERARIGGTDTDLSSANANIKQALGSLRAAQANFEKTVFRSPINGVVNELSVDTGDFVAAFTPIARVANNAALEITTFVSEKDREKIAVGDTVRIDGLYDGVITQIAPAINSETRKIEVKISTESDQIQNGDTVRVNISPNAETLVENNKISIPLSAVKFTTDKASVFFVENDVLTAREVIVGRPNGSSIEVLEGVSFSDEIVVDARGLNNGQKVRVLN